MSGEAILVIRLGALGDLVLSSGPFRDIREHRVKVGDHYYLTCRISREDAEARGIKDDDLIRLWNDRGSVVCAAQVTDRLRPGVVSAPTASAEYRPARGTAQGLGWLAALKSRGALIGS